MLSALIISILNFYLGAFVIPKGNVIRHDFEALYKNKKKNTSASNVQLQVGPGVIAYISQYDNITNLSVLTEGGSLSGQFILSTQYELNDKLTPLFGTFAARPTTTQPYAILYIATDQTGENKVTILPANTDGSVSGNWISI